MSLCNIVVLSLGPGAPVPSLFQCFPALIKGLLISCMRCVGTWGNCEMCTAVIHNLYRFSDFYIMGKNKTIKCVIILVQATFSILYYPASYI